MAGLTLGEIRAYWTQQAREHGSSHAASWSDGPCMELEVECLLQYLEDDENLLDIGCANGWATLQYASQRKIRVRGIDLLPEMIESARAVATGIQTQLRGDVEFEVGDILTLEEEDGRYDKVIVTRVLINLSDWDHQRQGLQHAARVLRPGGLLLLSEATRGGHARLNSFRAEWGLPPIPEPEFNCYLEEDRVIAALDPVADLVELVDFASSYYVGTRVLKPLLVEATNRDVGVADPNTEWNRWCRALPAAGDYGVQKLFVFKKR